eukprot:Protomagalhaensia_wolfi_Nauph_80__514@NODE_1290_length_1609_cov_58_169427_g996_i0_p2_GENE_NODE_1290_length_1609_cov_58_169427_g996_i0NODE_1290_length_1609_cov_58_169427_g996_i0_p2_ORF_typecomplete_len119_score13_54Bacillus_HBL/PF05791_11/0_16_NODE_1290_length_1609_cov_58_169427_g996_i07241080
MTHLPISNNSKSSHFALVSAVLAIHLEGLNEIPTELEYAKAACASFDECSYASVQHVLSDICADLPIFNNVINKICAIVQGAAGGGADVVIESKSVLSALGEIMSFPSRKLPLSRCSQ